MYEVDEYANMPADDKILAASHTSYQSLKASYRNKTSLGMSYDKSFSDKPDTKEDDLIRASINSEVKYD